MARSRDAEAYERTLRELYARAARGIDPGLARMERALALAGRPERAFDVIHVAGTNGKGSVSHAVWAGLGVPAGLFTSPHLHRLTERFRVRAPEPSPSSTAARGEAAERDVVEAWASLRPILDAPGAPPLTFFETVTLLALRLFERRGVSIAVLETGLGGRLDSTNVVAAPLFCAITRIGLDHQVFLGEDLASIAAEKAGILKPGVPCVVSPQRPEAMAVIEARAAAVGAPLIPVRAAGPSGPGRAEDGATGDRAIVGRGEPVARDGRGAARRGADPVWISRDAEGRAVIRRGRRTLVDRDGVLAAPHRCENAAVAAAVLWALEARGVPVDVPRGVLEARWAGRLERVTPPGGPAHLLDAAHNPDAARALAGVLARADERPRVLLFGAMADKDWPAMLDALRPVVEAIVFSRSPLPRAEDPHVLSARAGDRPAEAVVDVDEAMARAAARAGPDGLVVVAGSLFLMAEVRARLLGLASDPPIAM
ncbi:MAG TPA: cyanophycin synthetase [Sandaracinaceae bacterium LLY-WYZ-13_1]|nr:cyanophycin synthetase [Sandaracinaceae bacterium LLY-WYZ-13_1]